MLNVDMCANWFVAALILFHNTYGKPSDLILTFLTVFICHRTIYALMLMTSVYSLYVCDKQNVGQVDWVCTAFYQPRKVKFFFMMYS